MALASSSEWPSGEHLVRVHRGQVSLADAEGRESGQVVEVAGGWHLTPIGYERLSHRLAELQVAVSEASARASEMRSLKARCPPSEPQVLTYHDALLLITASLVTGLLLGLRLARSAS